MKRIALTICSATLLLVSCNNGEENKEKTPGTDSTGKKEPSKETTIVAPPDSATMMKNWQTYMTPGDVHKMMTSWNGTWVSDITMWEPGKEPMKSVGSCVNKMVLGGRYQESINTGSMMGMPFEGHGMLAYNNAKKVFENTWVDNMGTGIMMMSGPWNEATKSCTLTGKGVDPATLIEKDYKQVFKVVDDNTQMLEMYGPGPDGKEWKMMEIKYTRKK